MNDFMLKSDPKEISNEFSVGKSTTEVINFSGWSIWSNKKKNKKHIFYWAMWLSICSSAHSVIKGIIFP